MGKVALGQVFSEYFGVPSMEQYKVMGSGEDVTIRNYIVYLLM
jgi:protein involved in ribonucleotide reduction